MKHLVDLDEAALEAAKRELGTKTIKDTVNAALRMAAGQDAEGRDIDAVLDRLAGIPFADRAEAMPRRGFHGRPDTRYDELRARYRLSHTDPSNGSVGGSHLGP